MAGPLLILVLFALSFLCRGRVEFGNIYGFGLTGAIRIFLIINLMASRGQYVDLYDCISVLGYGFFPMLIPAYMTVFMDMNNNIGYVICSLFILLSTVTAARLFEYSLEMEDKRYLLAYPIILFYAMFV